MITNTITSAETLKTTERKEDAVVYAESRDGFGETEIVRCATWERAREWVDAFQRRGFKTRIAWEARESRSFTLYRRHLRRAKLYRRCGIGRDSGTKGYFRSKAETHIELADYHLYRMSSEGVTS